METVKSGENDASVDEEPNAKRHRGNPYTKSVVVLFDGDVTVRENGEVYMPNTIEMAQLKKPGKGQFAKISFTSEMTERDVHKTLHFNFPLLSYKRRLSCASAVENRTRLEFHGNPRLWNGALINKFIRGNSALYLLAEGSCKSYKSQVLPSGTVSEAATAPQNVLSQQKQPLFVKTGEEDFSALPTYNKCVNRGKEILRRGSPQSLEHDRTPGKWTGWESLLQRSTFMSPSRKWENETSVVLLGSQDCGQSAAENLTFQHMQHGFIPSATSTQKTSLQIKGLASEQSVNEDSMTSPIPHHDQADLHDKETLWGSSSKQSMQPYATQGTALMASQKLHVTQISSIADQRCLTGKEDPSSALVSNANQQGQAECLLQRRKEELTTQPPYPIRGFPQQGLSLGQKRQNDSIVHTCTSADPVFAASQDSVKPVSMASGSQHREFINYTSEQDATWQPVPPAAAATHKNVSESIIIQETTSPSTEKLSVNERKRKRQSHDHNQQENVDLDQLLSDFMSSEDNLDPGYESTFPGESTDTEQSEDNVPVTRIIPPEGSTKGGQEFCVILPCMVPLHIQSCVAHFEGCGTVPLVADSLNTLTGITPGSKNPGLVNVTVMSKDESWMGGKTKFLYVDRFTREELLLQLLKESEMQSKMCEYMHKGITSDLQTSDPSGKALPGSSGVNHSRHAQSVKLLQFLVYKAAQIGGDKFIQMIFNTSAGRVVFNNYKNNDKLPEHVARANGHKILAEYLQDVNNRLSEESNSDAGTETIDWLELKRAVDKEESLPCTEEEQMLKNCQPPSPKSDYDGSDYLADDELSACSSPSYSELSDTEHEDHSQDTITYRSLKNEKEEKLQVESLFPLHFVGNQLNVIPSIKAEEDAYEHKQLNSVEVESHSSEGNHDETAHDEIEANINPWKECFWEWQPVHRQPGILAQRNHDEIEVKRNAFKTLEKRIRKQQETFNRLLGIVVQRNHGLEASINALNTLIERHTRKQQETVNRLLGIVVQRNHDEIEATRNALKTLEERIRKQEETVNRPRGIFVRSWIIRDETNQVNLLEVRVKDLINQRNHDETDLDEIKASIDVLEIYWKQGILASSMPGIFDERRNFQECLDMIKARIRILERIISERRLGELRERRNREETLLDGIKTTSSNLERMNSEPRVRELVERRKTLLETVAGELDGIISETIFIMKLREKSRVFDHWLPYKWTGVKFLSVSVEAKQNSLSAVVKSTSNTSVLGKTGGSIYHVECEEQTAQKEHPPTPLTPDSILPVVSSANPTSALYVEELGRARTLVDLMATQYSMEREISCNPQSWTYIDEIMKKECNSTCIYISCRGQEVFLWILKPSGAISFCKVTVDNNTPSAKLGTNLDAVFAVMANSVLSEEDCNDQSVHDIEPKPDSFQILTWCYKLLVDPVSGLLEEPSIIIVPEGGLCLFPFAALLDDKSGKYLSETFRIRIVPSLKTLKLIQDSPADYHSQSGALVVGDPTVGEVIYRGSVSRKFVPLPGARKEAEMVGRLLGVQPLLEEYATKQAVLEMIMSASLIHIAAHGNAERGEIALAPLGSTTVIPQEDDYLLTVSDISQIQLRAKLVVLSCCHSGRGQIRSEEIIGMAGAFLGSGARSVLVALWALNDEATEQLMCRFYEHLVRGESASESLHQAMKWMRGNGFTKVSDWAPFTLIGDDVSFDFGKQKEDDLRKEDSI